MSTPYVFFNSSDFYDRFQPNNCNKNSGCWWDRNEECPVIFSILNYQQSPVVLTNQQGNPVCTAYQSHKAGRERQQITTRLEEHSGGLFPELGQQ